MKKTLFVFDIDGTITDSVTQHQSAFYESLEAFGIKTIDSNWGAYAHHTDSYIFKSNYEDYFGKQMRDVDLFQFESLILHHLSLKSSINEIRGASRFLELLSETGQAYCFATGSLKKPAINKLQQAKISINEGLLATANDNFSREDIVLNVIEKAKKLYHLDSFQKIVSFGDGIWDLKTAKNLNLSFVSIGNKSAHLLKEGADNHFNDFNTIQIDNFI